MFYCHKQNKTKQQKNRSGPNASDWTFSDGKTAYKFKYFEIQLFYVTYIFLCILIMVTKINGF